EQVAPRARPDGEHWHPGDAPSQALEWAVESLAKAGTLSIVGVYPSSAKFFPIGTAMNKNLTLKMGNCHHRKYIPKLLEMVRSGAINPTPLARPRGQRPGPRQRDSGPCDLLRRLWPRRLRG